ncbi:VOC family protein [Antarcticibacterium sp. 1MA-6-2]|uniref:VOC family protein n=1 Tax=Antarcticibacterium sp. 1MA-6-2 TaxID=2908210 RepID=UPI001F3A38D1|nr:VOC family protein [Antarcticibacterium sp. 1MA-6-2]UJH89711.1 VOC family protein [Antarcticibacterium sp. 1MA-6-2]
MNRIQPFHLAIPVRNLEENRTFYRETLGCTEGRSSDHWVDFDFFGHQLVIHVQETLVETAGKGNPVDGKDVPIPHFGVVLDWDVFEQFAEQLKQKNIEFVIEPYTRFKGKTGEQATMFFKDPSGNALEFKAFKDMSQLFAK